jgi:IS30 family transposase
LPNLYHAPSSISRELRHASADSHIYYANLAHLQSEARRVMPLRTPKLDDRTTRFVVLAKIDNASTKSIVDNFSAVLNREPEALRKSTTYDQGREMHGHKILA